MQAGKLDRRITLERASITLDDFGGQVEAWVVLATVWAEAIPVSDRERWRAGEIGATISHRFRIRWSSAVADLNARDRVIFDGREYDIHGVKEIGRRVGLEITASTRAD